MQEGTCWSTQAEFRVESEEEERQAKETRTSQGDRIEDMGHSTARQPRTRSRGQSGSAGGEAHEFGCGTDSIT